MDRRYSDEIERGYNDTKLSYTDVKARYAGGGLKFFPFLGSQFRVRVRFPDINFWSSEVKTQAKLTC